MHKLKKYDQTPTRTPKHKKKTHSQEPTSCPQEGQRLMTDFFKQSPITEYSDSSGLEPLKEQLKQKDKIIMDLQLKNLEICHQLKTVQKNHQQQLEQQKISLINSLREIAAIERNKKGQVNANLGFFRDMALGHFQQGQYLQQLRKTLQQQRQIKDSLLLSYSRNPNTQEIQSFLSKTEFINREITFLEQQLSIRQREVNNYKHKLKLASKESNCQLAKQKWPLLNQRYLTLELLGAGGFGEVYKAFDLETLTYVAVKLSIPSPANSVQADQKRIKYLKRECQTHKKLIHPNIVSILDQFQMDSNTCLVMEYCSGPDLATYLKKRTCLPEPQARRIIQQLTFVLKYLKQQKYRVIHFDLKPSNILFHHGLLKVIDFGICKLLDQQNNRIEITTRGIGTYWYLPPEIFDDAKQFISQKVDVWSIGVIFYQLLYGIKPFGEGLSQRKLLSQNTIVHAYQVSFPSETPKNHPVSPEAKQFIRECLKYNEQERLGILQLVNHKYLNDSSQFN